MILVGDVGGTRTRLALAAKADGGWRITGIDVNRGYASGALAGPSFTGAAAAPAAAL